MNKLIIILISIATILVMIVCIKNCKTTKVSPTTKIVSKIDTIYNIKHDTIFQNKIQLVPQKIIVNGKPEIQYIDTITDKGDKLTITDTIVNDSIVGRKVDLVAVDTTFKDSTTITKIQIDKKIHLYLGGGIDWNKQPIVEGELMWRGIGLITNIGKSPSFGLVIKIK